MNPRQRDVAQELFEDARDLTPEERAAYLAKACPSDPAMQEYILRLVAADEKDRDFLETPILIKILSAPLLEERELVDGRFRIIRLAGRGGMGEVYEAKDCILDER